MLMVSEDNFEAITKWNEERDNMEFNFELEKAMLIEELEEAKYSTSAIEFLDAVADFLFVISGTISKAKAKYKATEDIMGYLNALMPFESLLDEADIVFNAGFTTLSKIYDWPADDKGFVSAIVNDVLHIVVEANQQKPKEKDANGKIVKGKDFVKPEDTIQEYFDTVTATIKALGYAD